MIHKQPVKMSWGEWYSTIYFPNLQEMRADGRNVKQQYYEADHSAYEMGLFVETIAEEHDQVLWVPRGKSGYWVSQNPSSCRLVEHVPNPIITMDKRMNAPKVTPEEVEASIVKEDYVLLPDLRTTICLLTLDNGFTIRGESSCVNIENYNQEDGESYSRKNAVSKIWAFLGFRLADRMSVLRQADTQGMLDNDCIYVGTKAVKALPMTRGEYNAYRGWTLPADEDATDDGYLVEYMDGGKPNHDKHTGYISWSPKDIFQRSYKKV